MEIGKQFLEDSQNTQRDSYTQMLLSSKQELQQCQNQHGFSSCMQCHSIFECQVRTRYVNAVYESMNRGQVGDFDFN
ncbi:hypothetical protein CQA66_05710 [Helicobacter aurati]|uniref:Uncharacterized protein n=1 Tax=Helicobacter aurati TaxID=137778 RepID=A0A3D8J400_9HELI|nr:hypothetical protein [Helicobacter aurati]RDU71956.1 hypothetical protein CQA66_05710 [Helicobacter aurati]